MQLSSRVQAIKPSATLAVTAKSKAMKAEGIDVVGFGAGEPDFDTPEHIKDAAKKALDDGVTKYQPTPGTPAARKAVADYMNQRFGYSFGPEHVLISAGGKHALYLAFEALINPGDEVILPAPYWVSYPEQARLAGAVVREVPGSVGNDFKITPDQLAAAINERTKIVVITSPSNPTGTTYTRDELAALAEVIAKHPQVIVFSDEIYERLVYGDTTATSFASLNEQLAKRTVTFNCLSKTYSMTGWRIGFTIADPALIKAMAAMQGQMTSNITSFCYAAIPAALAGPQDEVENMRQAFEQRGTHMHQRISELSGVRCPKPTGAFYVFPDISEAAFGKTDPAGKAINSAADFAESLLEHAKVAVVPGEDFGAPNHVRLSFATSLEQIDKGLDRIADYLSKLR
ncbi:pyridoxal phosphate-dependent aminotransferase [Phycisphaerales bacterium AB-hyl4]|uniref:Pyridoxal phosphate-dependent aminotransferase n=1 Tax=Natronomicrosphaera hydrolytica TaxID=3242702 RepID=A0ABV4U213_9BACT